MKNRRTEGGTLISQIHQVSQRVWYDVLSRNGLEDLAGARGRVIFALWNEDNPGQSNPHRNYRPP